MFQVTTLHLQRLQRYRANEILLTQRNNQTYKHLPKYSQPFTWWSTLQDMSSKPLFGLLAHTPTDTLKTTPAFAIAAGNKDAKC